MIHTPAEQRLGFLRSCLQRNHKDNDKDTCNPQNQFYKNPPNLNVMTPLKPEKSLSVKPKSDIPLVIR